MYCPSYNPNTFIFAEDLYYLHTSTIVPDDEKKLSEPKYLVHSESKTVELLLDWQNTGSLAKSNKKVNCLVHMVLFYPEFQIDTLQSFNATCKNQKADVAEEQLPFLSSF